MSQAFEAHPKLAAHIERMAWNGIGSMSAWQSFTDELNAVISALTQSQRTAGTVEVCEKCLSAYPVKYGADSCNDARVKKLGEPCPLRPQRTQEG